MADVSFHNDPRPVSQVPSPELVLGAYRKAIGRRERHTSHLQRQGETQQQGLALGRPPSAVNDEEQGPELVQKSKAGAVETWVEETLTAFRTAGGEIGNGRADQQTRDQTPVEGMSEENSAGAPGPRPAPSEAETERKNGSASDGSVTDEPDRSGELKEGAEDRARAFRRAFYRRRVRHASPDQTGADEKSFPTIVFPARPAPSFLWVSGRSDGSTTSVGIQHLAGSRAQRAGAFLLRGGEKGAYRLLRGIRHHPEPRIFLKPVFSRGSAAAESSVADHVDGTWTPRAGRDALRALRERAAAIHRRIRDVVAGDEVATGTNAERRLLRFVATRTDEFAPRRVGRDTVYPGLMPLLGKTRHEEN